MNTSITQMQADDVAQLVGMSVNEVSDLLGLVTNDENSTMTALSSAVIQIAKVLNSAQDCINHLTDPQLLNGGSSTFKEQLSALLVMMEAEVCKSGCSLKSCVVSLPGLARACLQNTAASGVLQDVLCNFPQMFKSVDKLDALFQGNVDFYSRQTQQ